MRRKALRQLKAAEKTLTDILAGDDIHQPQVSGPQYLVREAQSVLRRYEPEEPIWILESSVEKDVWGMPLYWLHDMGWVDFDNCTHYDEQRPALEGLWVRL